MFTQRCSAIPMDGELPRVEKSTEIQTFRPGTARPLSGQSRAFDGRARFRLAAHVVRVVGRVFERPRTVSLAPRQRSRRRARSSARRAYRRNPSCTFRVAAPVVADRCARCSRRRVSDPAAARVARPAAQPIRPLRTMSHSPRTRSNRGARCGSRCARVRTAAQPFDSLRRCGRRGIAARRVLVRGGQHLGRFEHRDRRSRIRQS